MLTYRSGPNRCSILQVNFWLAYHRCLACGWGWRLTLHSYMYFKALPDLCTRLALYTLHLMLFDDHSGIIQGLVLLTDVNISPVCGYGCPYGYGRHWAYCVYIFFSNVLINMHYWPECLQNTYTEIGFF